MALNRFIGTTLDGPISSVRRQAIGITICAAACVGAIFYFAQAAVIALDPLIGPVLAYLAVGGGFLIVAALGLAVPRMFNKDSVVERAQAQTETMSREQKFALIVEALLAGFSMSSKRSHAGGK
jgi:hypothetical protein